MKLDFGWKLQIGALLCATIALVLCAFGGTTPLTLGICAFVTFATAFNIWVRSRA